MAETNKVAVVMVPLPAQGHLNQLLHLSRLISAYKLPLHFAGATVHLRQARTRLHGWDPLSISNITFHEFPTPEFETTPPNPHSKSKFPTQLVPSFFATFQLRDPITSLLRELSRSHTRVVVVYDSLMPYVLQDSVSMENVECYCFNSTSAFTIFTYIWEFMGKPAETEDEFLKKIPSYEDSLTPEFFEFANAQTQFRELTNSGDLYNSCYEIDGKYLDMVSQKKWVIGPLNPVVLTEEKDPNNRHECLKWLDKQAPNSVIFVSFGTTTSLSDDEIKELAIGLEQSQQNFIWVLRDADKGDIFKGESRKVELPQGYEKRIEGRGIVVRDWAPQLEILGHSSTGGFMSHCGWNSCIESISMGVPILAWPMHSDQPRNAFLVTEVLKIGIALKEWEKRDELVSPVIVKESVKRLMDSTEGDEMRKKAMELGKSVRKAVEDGGRSHMEMDAFIAHITR